MKKLLLAIALTGCVQQPQRVPFHTHEKPAIQPDGMYFPGMRTANMPASYMHGAVIFEGRSDQFLYVAEPFRAVVQSRGGGANPIRFEIAQGCMDNGGLLESADYYTSLELVIIDPIYRFQLYELTQPERDDTNNCLTPVTRISRDPSDMSTSYVWLKVQR